VTPGDDTENTFVFTFPTREFQVQPKLGSIADSPINDGYEPGHLDGVITDDRESWGNTRNAELNINMEDATIKKTKGPMAEVQKANRKRKVKISKHGIQFPSLPAGVVKKLAATYARTGGSSRFKISKEILDAIIKASDWFLEQLSDDLGAYAKHAGRKTINEYDIITLMKRCVIISQVVLIIPNTMQTTPD
jgi:histone H3/H4